jgi:hypothetical protein
VAFDILNSFHLSCIKKGTSDVDFPDGMVSEFTVRFVGAEALEICLMVVLQAGL